MVRWGRRILSIEMTHGELADLSLSSEGIDAVTMWDYLEHSRDPTHDVRAAHRFCVPAESSLYRRGMRARCCRG
jgi:hypothetical protein